MLNKITTLLMMGITAVFAVALLLTNLQTAAAENTTLLLYDGALGGLPDEQLLVYGAANLIIFPPQDVMATQTYSAPLTILDTTPEIRDYAGYAITPTLSPVLTRTIGFTLNFTIRLNSEAHESNDRAGFSVILLGEDTQGIELAFWEGEIWAQADTPLFTHAEGVVYDTTAVLTPYQLVIRNDTYYLSAAAAPILTGDVRDYSAWEPPLPGLPDPYEQPNLVFFGDNTSSAQSETWFAYAAITTVAPSTPELTPTPELSPTPEPSATPEPEPDYMIYLPLLLKN